MEGVGEWLVGLLVWCVMVVGRLDNFVVRVDWKWGGVGLGGRSGFLGGDDTVGILGRILLEESVGLTDFVVVMSVVIWRVVGSFW